MRERIYLVGDEREWSDTEAPRDYELALGQVISAYNAVAPPPPIEPPDPDDRLRRGTSTATSR